MRRLLLSALVLLPALASAQTSTSTATQSSAATLQAKLTPPAALLPAAATAVAAAPGAADIMVPVHETIVDRSAEETESGLGYSYTHSRPTAPKLMHAVPMQLSLKEMRAETEPTTTIVVRVVVTAEGAPTQLAITRSGGAALDQRALDAVAQYRFQPATQDNIPVTATATVAFQLKKS